MSYQLNALKTFPKIVCVGKNYLKHVKEMGGSQIPSSPVIFTKPWTSIAYNPSSLALAWASTHRIDHELQLGVYISKSGSKISRQNAFQHVGGYFIGIDFTDRDFQAQAKKAGMPWALAKGQDNFCPLSEFIPKEIDPYSVELELRVNGQTRQQDLAGNMHFKIDEIIQYISQYIRLEEGDLLFTGTPDGVGGVKVGDHVEAFGRISGNIIAKLEFDVV